MVAAIRLRDLSAEEQARIDKLAHSRTAPARQVERARIIRHASQGHSAPRIAQLVGAEVETVRRWMHRFNAEGLDGLEDRRRAGRPVTYTAEQVATVIATALTAPRTLGLPFATWTLDRLATYLQEHRGIAMKRSRIDEILLREGLRWRKHETWFGARVDPEFAEKRGRSKPSTRPRLRAVSSSAWTRWGP
jgi:transposase